MVKTTLTPEQVDRLKRADTDALETLQEVQALEECGQDCTAARQMVTEVHDRIIKVLKRFSPPE